MSRNNYNDSKCSSAVEALYKCCDAMYAAADKRGERKEVGSTACPVREIVQRKMKGIPKGQLAEEMKG